MEYKYYLSKLNSCESELYSFLYERISGLADSFSVGASAETVHRIIKAIMLDNPELFWFEGKWKAVYEDNAVVVCPRYKEKSDYINTVDNIEKSIACILQSCKGSDTEKIKTSYDWFIRNIQYAYSDNDQTVEGVFVDGKAICKGIAKAFQLIMNRLNIPSFLIEGTLDGQVPHVWNVVFVNGKFYHVDVTMGYGRFGQLFRGMNRNRHYPCFMVSDKTILMTHKIYEGDFPECTDDFNLDKFIADKLNIPERFRQYGEFRYLDKGSTCTVLRVTGRVSEYALKIVDADGDERKYNAVCSELEKMKRLVGCRGITELVDSAVIEKEKRAFMLLRYYKPLTVRRREKDFDIVKSTLQLGIDVLEALIECLEKDIYHLDIQPKNIYFDDNNKAVLGDLSSSAFAQELKKLGRCRGTFAFMAPEVYRSGIYTQASDIYSLGIVMYSLLNDAKLPFIEGNNFSYAIKLRLSGKELPPAKNSSEEIWSCLKKMCSFNTEERYNSFGEARLALKALLEKYS